MLSDEERKAIDYLQLCYDLSIITNESLSKLGIALNLIEKQSKEIEELKEKNKKLQDKCKELIFEKQELTSALLDSTPNDKIKATIEEVDKDENASIPDFMEYAKEYAKQKLQSLLEKE